jgi:predicted nuclease of restriction endonuclease-like (RecB) superfamily
MRKTKRKPATRQIVQQPAAQLYLAFLEEVKKRIRTAQVRTVLAAHAELVLHYWDLGRMISEKQGREGWGARVIDRLAADVRKTFPKLAGYSVRNLKYMKAFAEEWPTRTKVQQLAAQIPWMHNCMLLDKIKDKAARAFYVCKTLENGWSRSVLAFQIETRLHERQGKALNNFSLTLPSPSSDLARDILKDPYMLSPAPLDESADERALENALLDRLKDFLLELGAGFAFVGRQYRLEVKGDEFYIDLLFYHTRLHCYVVIDLKAVDFKPEFAGKIGFYQRAVDKMLRGPGDKPTIGLVLCKGRNRTVVEYTLDNVKSPMGVSEYRLLPAEFRKSLPATKEMARLLEGVKRSEN